MDDCLVVSRYPEEALSRLGKYFTFKEGFVGPPKLYLGTKISQVGLPNGVKAWAWSSSKYIQEAINSLEIHLERRGYKLKNKASTPIGVGYRPECDMSKLCDEDDARLYLSLIGTLRWMVEIGRVDLTCEVSMMASYSAMPTEGHVYQLFHMFSYLKEHHNSCMVFYPSYPDIDLDAFPKKEWKQHYGDAFEVIPSDCPEPYEKELLIRACVDVEFACDKVTRRSRTGFIVMLDNAPVYWYSKQQTACETSSFGNEFLAMKSLCEYLRGLSFKLRQMGILVNNSCFVF